MRAEDGMTERARAAADMRAGAGATGQGRAGTGESARAWPPSRGWLMTEFLGLYLLIPLAIALFLPPRQMFPALFAMTALGLVLLARTPDFRWRELAQGWRGLEPRLLAGFGLVTFLACVAVMLVSGRGELFGLPRHNPRFWLLILLLYPLLSALPQELIFRALFFHRYARLLPGRRVAVLVNAGLFSLAHLMYWSWLVAVMTFAGGLVFGWAYAFRQSFALAFVLHALAGGILFSVGLGLWFYSGNVVRPF